MAPMTRTSLSLALIAPLAPLALIALLTACSGSADDSAPAPTFDANPPTEIGGDREAAVVLPANYAVDAEYPLVILVHGYGVNADIQEVIFGLGQRVDDLGFILVKPEGTVDSTGSQFWNATEECCDFGNTGVDDVAYLSGLIDEARTLYPISTVAFVGHSNGGFMSYRMACEVPEKIDRIAVLAGAVYKDEADCVGTQPVSVLHVHGTLDDSVAYESDPGHAGAEESVERWATKAGCTEPPTVLGTRDYMSRVDGEETTVSQWEGCASGTDIQLWSAVGADHTFLDSTDLWRDDVAVWATR
jgi:polyhydroxybutyrate depolymerase